jgi:hypothetical protein
MEKITKSVLKSWIAEDKLELAIKRLLNLFKSIKENNNDDGISDNHNMLILLASRLNGINHQYDKGIMSIKTLNEEKNELRLITLKFINNLPNTVFSAQNLQEENEVERSAPGVQNKQINIQNEFDQNLGEHKKNKKIREEEFIQEMIKIKTFSDQIEGYWWEKVLPNDGSALSFVSIKEEDETKKLKLIGKAYGVDGVIIAKWHTISCCIDLSQTSIFYVWNGWHYKEPSVLKEGWSKIDFMKKNESFNIAEGKFSDVNPAIKKYESKTITMQRCSESEIETMFSDNPVKKKALILEKLQTIE